MLIRRVHDLLDFSKLDAGRFALDPAALRLRHLVSETMQRFAARAADKKLAVSSHVNENAPDAFVGDPKRVGQLLAILVDNAVKFTERGSVRVRVAVDSPNDGRATVRFEVADTGAGIAAEHRERVFEPFVQLDASSTRRHGGTGLGLAIAREMARLMEGLVELAGNVEGGSTFTAQIKLALAETARRVARGRRSFAERNRFGRIARRSSEVVANRAAAERLTIIARLAGGRHGGQSEDRQQDSDDARPSRGDRANGREVVELVSQRPFDVVLMDLQMPIMDGLEAATAIRALEVSADRRVPIVALTAHAMLGDREHCLAVGMDEYLAKPVDTADLIETVERLPARKQSSRSDDSAAAGTAVEKKREERSSERSPLRPERGVGAAGERPRFSRQPDPILP